MKNYIKNVAVYCRVSTEEQKKFGISVQDQKDSLTRYCKENKYKIYDYYIDEGVSAGTISKRKEFVRLLQDLDNIDLIIFTKLDRFSRNVRDANNLLVELDKHNTAFKAIDEDDIDVSTSDGRFIFNLKVNLAEHERNKDSERINRVNKYKYHTAGTVCTGKKIFGYDISEDKKLVVNENEAKQINQLFDKYIETNCLNETVRWFQTNIKKRSYASVRLYLTNTAYIGQYKHIRKNKDTEIIENFSPIIVEETKFTKVQKMLNTNVKKYVSHTDTGNKKDYIFSGLLYCNCGFKLAGKHSKGKHYYICKRALTTLCDNKLHISEINLENYLLSNIKSEIKEVISEDEQIKFSSSNVNNDLEKEKIKIKNKLNKLTNLYLEDMIDKDVYKTEYSTLKQELELINKSISQISKPKNFSNLEKFLKSDWENVYNSFSNRERREFWMTIIDYISFENKDKFKIEFRLY